MRAASEEQFIQREVFGMLYIANLLFSLHLFFLIYINSSFLSRFVGETLVGSVFLIGSVISIFAFLCMPRILRALGNYKSLIVFTVLEILTLVGLALSGHIFFVILLFTLHVILARLMILNFDVFLESYSVNEARTGKIRGTFLTVTNTALLLSPLIVGFLLSDENFSKIYLIAAAFLVPFLFIIMSRFHSFKDPQYDDIALIKTLACIRQDRNIYGVVMSHFLLRFFFSFMVIYMPIYLHQHIGFSWPEIGIIFTVMLLPFVLFEYPLGRLADTRVGEKEILLIGFIILIASTAFIPFMATAALIPWAILLFLTRVGASFAEITTESYFFKHVDGTDTNTISLFRITRPASFIAGPLIATVALFFVEIQYLFLLLAIILLWGIYFSLQLKDTK